MEIDFKHYRYKRPYEKRRKRRRNLIILFIIFIGISLLLWDQLSLYYLNKGKILIYQEKYLDAEKSLQKALKFHRRRAQINDALGVCYIFLENFKRADYFFGKALKKKIKKSVFFWEDIQEKLISKGDYESALIYSQYLKKWLDSPYLPFYQASALLGKKEITKAEELIREYSNEVLIRYKDRVNIQKKIISELKKNKVFYFVLDRANKPFLGKKLNSGKIIPIKNLFLNLNFEAFSSKDFENKTLLTINSKIQESAIKALGKYDGSIVAINPGSGEILCAVSKKKIKNSNILNECFEKLYEPGSIIKLITSIAYLQENKNGIFPFECKGVQEIDGKLFYDWIVHNKIENLEQALTVSCNLCFANIGLKLGGERIEKAIMDFLNLPEIKMNIVPLKDFYFSFNPKNSWDLARLSVGLDGLRITPFQACIIASIIANRGVLMKPYLIKEKRNIYDIPYFKNFPEKIKNIVSPEICSKITKAMIEVVENPDGTGKRARIKGLKFALKTGTAGEKKEGYNSILIGFAPAFNPKIAFSIFVEKAGRAELEGAKTTRKFLEGIKEELH